MAAISAEHINVFLMASTKILKDMCNYTVKIGKPFVKPCQFQNETLVIMIGVTGEMRGQVMLAMDYNMAYDIASKMMMMPISQLDDMSESAISELANMIMGNASTVFSVQGIGIDITPPTICKGNMSFQGEVANLCVPLYVDGEEKMIELNLTMK